MLGRLAGLALQACTLLGTLQLAAASWGVRATSDTLVQAAGEVGKGASRCLRTALSLLAGSNSTDGSSEAAHGFLGYAHAAAAGVGATVATAFHNKSPWTAVALLDLGALWSVWRRHKQAHAEAAVRASVRRAAEDPENAATHVQQPAGQELALLQCAAAHSKAAYGAPAASGQVSSATGYLSMVTIGNATRKAPRHIPAAQHLSAVQQLTGCPPADVLVAQWQSHLHRPAFYAAVDRRRRCIVVSIRGTLQLGDFCTVLDAVPQPVVLCGIAGHVHGGFMAAACNLVPQVTAALRTAARACPGWPVLLTGHSLGGGVASVLAMLLIEQRQQQQLLGNSTPSGSSSSEVVPWEQLGEISCVGVGAAAAFCQDLGMACKRHGIISVLYGADCLPMFSVLGARLLIEEVHARSKAAALVSGIVQRCRRKAGSNGNGSFGTGSSAADLARTASTVSTSSAASSLSCEAVCGSGGCRGLCADAVADSASELSLGEIEDALPGPGRGHLRRTSSCWSSASTASIAAFAADQSSAGGAALVPMFPAGRILWLLPPGSDGGKQQQQQQQRPTLVETDQMAFERFLFTLETTAHHLPDTYADALATLGQ